MCQDGRNGVSVRRTSGCCPFLVAAAAGRRFRLDPSRRGDTPSPPPLLSSRSDEYAGLLDLSAAAAAATAATSVTSSRIAVDAGRPATTSHSAATTDTQLDDRQLGAAAVRPSTGAGSPSTATAGGDRGSRTVVAVLATAAAFGRAPSYCATVETMASVRPRFTSDLRWSRSATR